MSGSGGSSLVNRHRLSLFHVTQSDSFFCFQRPLLAQSGLQGGHNVKGQDER